ncbi:MAG: TolC family protein [Flavobacteriaceae bacterium]
MRKLILFIMLCTNGIIWSQNEISLSLDEAISYALEHNRNAKNASRDIEAAEKQQWETIAIGLPQINAGISYQNNIKQQVSLIPAEFFGGNPGEFEEVIFGTKQNAQGFASLNQLIFNGSYIVGLQASRVFLEISKFAKEKTDLEVRQAVIKTYGNVLVSEESIRILENNKEVLDKNVNETQKIYDNGLAELESLEQLQITLQSIESSLNKAYRFNEITKKMLNVVIGLEINETVILSDKLEDLTFKKRNNTIAVNQENLDNNIDLKIAENNKASKELLVKLEKSNALPTLNAYLNGSYSGFSNNFSFLERDQNWYGASVVGVNLSIPVFSSLGRSAATQRAKINYEKAKDDYIEIEQNLILQLETVKNEYQFAIEDLDIKKKSLALAERIESKNQTKFFEGVGSSFDLRQAQTQLYNAQSELLQAMLSVINKKTELETVLNNINN